MPSDARPEDAARGFLSNYGKIFGLTNQARELKAIKKKTVDRGRSFVRFQQMHKDIPVFGGELNVQTDAGKNIVSANGEILPDLSVDVTPKIDSASAMEKAIGVVAKNYNIDAAELAASSPELWIYNPIMLKPARDFNALVWRMDVTPNRLLPIRELVLVDAHTGIVALHFNQVPHAKNRLTYTASNTTTLPGTLVCNELNPTCIGGDSHAVAAHIYAGHTYDFYSTNHGRDSINNAGMNLVSTVHYNTNYANAYWSGSQMVYGDANGYALADDVVAHELTHGVTAYESGLVYYYQAGAINESLSDVWGEFVDQTNGAGTDTLAVKWQIGEDITGLGAFRNMADPTIFGDPDRIGSTNYDCDESYNNDNGGVHTNSGVNNKAAYLMVDGGTFNTYTVTALGITKVAKIYYEAQTNLLLSASDYNDLYNALQQACTNLVGTSGITASDCLEVTDAVNAVEMNQQPTSCTANEKAPLCPTGLSPNNIFFDNLENPSSGNWVSGAISGVNAWHYPNATYATSGQYNIWGDDQGTAADYYISLSSNLSLPTGSTLYMHFNHAYDFEDNTLRAYDGGVLEYSINNSATWNDASSLLINNGYNGTISTCCSNPLGGRSAFVRESNGYYSSRLDLTSLSGQNMRFRFRIGTDSTYDDYGWFIDDIRVYTCIDTTAPDTTITSQPLSPSNSTSASFSFTSTETGGTFLCQMDSGGYSACTSPKSYTGLTAGSHTFYVKATDSAGNTDSTPASNTWTIDTTAPSGSAVSINSGASSTTSTSVTLTLLATDSVGVTGYYASEISTTPSATASGWTSGTSTTSYSASVSWTLSSSSGTKTVYVWFKDSVGNISASASDTITLTISDSTAPSSPSVSINNGDASTTSTSVTLSLSATDNAGVTAYYASETSTTPSSTASGWTSGTSTTSYSASVSWTLSSGSGTKTVYVWFRDSAGNVSASSSDSITLVSAPSAPTGVTADAGNGQVSVSWTSVSDATSYNIYSSTTSGVTKLTGTKLTNGTSPYSHTGLTNGTTYYYVVTAVNSYGESSESSQVSATLSTTTTIDTTAPSSPLVSINNGDTSTTSTSVTLSLSATDNVGVTGYCAKESSTTPSNSDSCWTSVTSTTSYSATVSFTLSSGSVGDNTKTVYVWFKDTAGNVSSSASDSITLTISDSTAPLSPSVSIDSGAASTTSTAVTLTLSATDNVGVTGYYASETSTTPSANASGWTSVTSTTSYSATVSFTLSSGSVGDNTKTVYVWFKDSAGNVSASASDSITLTVSDTTAPTDGTLSATVGSSQVSLSWSGFSDSGGIASYKLVYSTTSSPSSCIAGTLIYSGTGTSYTHTSLTNGTTYYYRVCAIDNAENTSSGTTNWATPTSTLSSPVTVVAEGGQLPKIKKYGNNVHIINTDSSRNLRFYKSTDNGASFLSNSTLATNIMNGTEFEFSMDSNGYLYAFWEDQTNDQLYIRRSFDSGGSWSSATSVASGFTWIDDPSCYFSSGTMYLLFRGYKNSIIELWLTKSTDNGATFSTPVQVTSNSIQEDNGSIAVYGSNVYVIYFDAYSTSPYNIYLVKSTNGGSSFGSPIRVNQTLGKTDFGFGIAVNSSGNIFIAHEDTNIDYEGNLYVAKSTDGGGSFTYTLATDSTYRNQDYPKIFIDSNNYIHLLWNDNRVNVSYGSVYYTRSIDGGATYQTNTNIRSSGGISNGSLYVDSNVVYITVTDYNTSPYSTLFYKFN